VDAQRIIKSVKTLTKIVGILAEISVLYGLYSAHVVTGQLAIMVGLITVVFVLVVSDLENTLQLQIGRVGKTVVNICMYIITKDNLQAGYFAASSPIVLTPFAQKVLRESGAQKIINDSLPILIAKIETKKPKDELDVRNKAFSVMEELVATDQFGVVKNFVYQHPKYPDQYGADFNILILINLMAVYLTGEYLKTHQS